MQPRPQLTISAALALVAVRHVRAGAWRGFGALLHSEIKGWSRLAAHIPMFSTRQLILLQQSGSLASACQLPLAGKGYAEAMVFQNNPFQTRLFWDPPKPN